MLGKARTCCYMRDGLGLVRVDSLESDVSVVIESPSRIRICGFYKPFTYLTSQCPRKMEEILLESIAKASSTHLDFIAGGDMNIDLLKTNNKSFELQQWMLDSGLNQHVHEITRYRKVNLSNGSQRVDTSLIDHVYSNMQDVPVQILPTDHSDGDVLIVNYSLGSRIPRRTVKKIRDWRNYSFDSLRESLTNVIIRPLNYKDELKRAYDELVPIKSCRIRDGQIINPRLEELKKKRDRLVKKFKKTNKRCFYDEAKMISKKLKKGI